MKGFKYIHAHTPCPPGWQMEERIAVSVARLAVTTGLYVLYEIENGQMKLSEPSAKLLGKKKLPPVSQYMQAQGRFRALTPADIDSIQNEIDTKWAGYRRQMTSAAA